MTEQTQSIHQQVANFVGAQLSNATINVQQMESMQIALNWLKGVAEGKLQVLECAPGQQADFYECGPDKTLCICAPGAKPKRDDCKFVGTGITTLPLGDCE